jgi:hypothetical protein
MVSNSNQLPPSHTKHLSNQVFGKSNSSSSNKSGKKFSNQIKNPQSSVNIIEEMGEVSFDKYFQQKELQKKTDSPIISEIVSPVVKSAPQYHSVITLPEMPKSSMH